MAPTQTVVPVSVERGMILVPILANGNIAGRLIVDTGASITILGPDIVKALRLTVPADAARVSFRLADGRLVQHPIVRLASLRVGDMTVEDLDVALGERSGPGDGLLGQNFLRHFCVSIEPARGRLVLDSLR
jgi:predicted aspartyl protease